MEKTNVMRLLEQKKIKYESHCYADTDAVSGMDVGFGAPSGSRPGV